MKFYIASSWRNPLQPEIVKMVRAMGHEVYDFRNPKPGDTGFHWSEIDPNWEAWDAERYRAGLAHPIAEAGFKSDYDAMQWADACVLVLPCGRSAHLEAGWMIGQGKPTCIALAGEVVPELMYKMAAHVAVSVSDLYEWLEQIGGPVGAIRP